MHRQMFDSEVAPKTFCSRSRMASQISRARPVMRSGSTKRSVPITPARRTVRSPDHAPPHRRRLPALDEQAADLAQAQITETQMLERTPAAGEASSEEDAEDREQARHRRARHRDGARRRFEEAQAEGDILGDVPVLVRDDLAPQPAR